MRLIENREWQSVIGLRASDLINMIESLDLIVDQPKWASFNEIKCDSPIVNLPKWASFDQQSRPRYLSLI